MSRRMPLAVESIRRSYSCIYSATESAAERTNLSDMQAQNVQDAADEDEIEGEDDENEIEEDKDDEEDDENEIEKDESESEYHFYCPECGKLNDDGDMDICEECWLASLAVPENDNDGGDDGDDEDEIETVAEAEPEMPGRTSAMDGEELDEKSDDRRINIESDIHCYRREIELNQRRIQECRRAIEQYTASIQESQVALESLQAELGVKSAAISEVQPRAPGKVAQWVGKTTAAPIRTPVRPVNNAPPAIKQTAMRFR